jgi:hypothetical protein
MIAKKLKSAKPRRGRPVSTGTGVSISLYLPKPMMDALFKMTPKGSTLGDTIRKLIAERLGR